MTSLASGLRFRQYTRQSMFVRLFYLLLRQSKCYLKSGTCRRLRTANRTWKAGHAADEELAISKNPGFLSVRIWPSQSCTTGSPRTRHTHCSSVTTTRYVTTGSPHTRHTHTHCSFAKTNRHINLGHNSLTLGKFLHVVVIRIINNVCKVT